MRFRCRTLRASRKTALAPFEERKDAKRRQVALRSENGCASFRTVKTSTGVPTKRTRETEQDEEGQIHKTDSLTPKTSRKADIQVNWPALKESQISIHQMPEQAIKQR